MAVFFTSDTHFGHANIIDFCRPFGSVEHMDETMVKNWNIVVSPDDTVWHLGDFALESNAKRLRSVFRRLNGHKRLVIGNHDRAETLALPWATPPTHVAETSVNGLRIVMCHYGMRVWPGMRRKAISLYGHSHGRLPVNSMSLDVGVDVWGYCPTRLDDIPRRMRTLPEAPEPEGDPGGWVKEDA